VKIGPVEFALGGFGDSGGSEIFLTNPDTFLRRRRLKRRRNGLSL